MGTAPDGSGLSGRARGYDAYFAADGGPAAAHGHGDSARTSDAQLRFSGGYGEQSVGAPLQRPPAPADPGAHPQAPAARDPSPSEPMHSVGDPPWIPARALTPYDAARLINSAERPILAQSTSVPGMPVVLNSLDLLADIAAARPAQLRSTRGVRGVLNKVGFRLGLSEAEQATEDRRASIRRQLTRPYQIAVISVKGGVGRTTTVGALGSTFASLRPDRVVAIDANPDFGDLPARTARHPYGLTLRDLAESPHTDTFSSVQSFASITDWDLAVVASPWSTKAIEPLTGAEYDRSVEILCRHYNLVIVDCGTGVLHSSTSAVLQTSDAVVIVTKPTVGGVTGAVATLNWLSAHGLQQLMASSIVAIVGHPPGRPAVDIDQIERLFATAQRPTCLLPYDTHLAEGSPIDMRLLGKKTRLAFEELASALAEGFPDRVTGPAVAHGEWQ